MVVNWLKSLFRNFGSCHYLVIDYERGEWWIQGVRRDGSSMEISEFGSIPKDGIVPVTQFCVTAKIIPRSSATPFKDRLTDDQVNNGFSVANDNPQFLAVLQVLGDHIEDAANLVSAMKTAETPGYLAHAAGQLEALTGLRDGYVKLQQTYGEKL
jgi:hypothetical protein